MVRHYTLEVLRAVVDRIPIIRRRPRAQSIAILPVQIPRDPRCIQRRLLPRRLDRAVVGGNAVLLQQTGLAGGFARGAVRAHPPVAPFVRGAPAVRVQVEGAKVDGGDGEVAGEVAAFDVGVGVAAVGEEVEPEALYMLVLCQ